MEATLVNFDAPSETRRFAKGRFDLYRVGPMTLGRATYDPGWKWSEHVGAPLSEPPGHDSWVVGDEPYVSLHILGSDDYAAR